MLKHTLFKTVIFLVQWGFGGVQRSVVGLSGQEGQKIIRMRVFFLWFGSVRFGSVRFGLVRFGSVWFGGTEGALRLP